MRLEKANQFKKEMEEARVASLENKLKLQAKAEKKREETTKMKEKLRKHNNKEAQEKREITKQRYLQDQKADELEARRKYKELMEKDKVIKEKIVIA